MKYHCNHYNRIGHTEDRYKFKYNTWIINNSRSQNNWEQHESQDNISLLANIAKYSQSKNKILSQDDNDSHGFQAKQLQQISYAESLSTQNNNSTGNGETYANATSSSLFHNISINSAYTRPWILDSWAPDHITFNSTLFIQIKSLSIPIIN